MEKDKVNMKRKYLSLIISLLVIIVLAVGITACSEVVKNNNSGNTEIENPVYDENTLSFIKSDFKFTQEQATSKIKAEYLKTNGGYKPSDLVVIILSLQEESLISLYNDGAYEQYSSVAEFISSEEGQYQALKIKEEQNSALAYLEQKNFVRSMKCAYSAITNAIVIETEYENLEEIESFGFVSSAIMSETYNQPVLQAAESGDASAIRNLVDIYETGIFDSSSVEYTGAGTIVAVLDNGFDLSHTVFQNEPKKPILNRTDVRDLMNTTGFVATELTKGLQDYNVYYSTKIPYKYDYADKDYDVNPAFEEHGTHVSGIIGGHDDVITGVAVDTQLVLMKVFPDNGNGAETDDILNALNDAIIMGVDCINMSLGSACGFTRERDQDKINKIYDSIANAGISLIAAASNDYSSGFGGDQGNTNKVTNPDSGTVGSPSTYDAALSVASISGVMDKYVVANGSQTFFYKESNSISGDQNKFYEELYAQQNLDPNGTYEFEYVTVPGVGLRVNFRGLDLTGKVALIKRGDNTFEEKAMLAKDAGAIACIIYNNIEGDILMSMGKTDHIPTVSISKSDGELLAKRSSGTMVFNMKQQAGPFMNDFSSWGPTPSLELKPEITGHGGTITSSVHGGGYDELSGTSMACPNVCGLTVLIRQYLKEKFPEYNAKQITNLTNSLLMSTASIIYNEKGTPYSPRKQGSGLASLKNTVTTNVYFTVDNEDKPKLQLGDDPERKGFFSMNFNIVNMSDKALDYTMDLISMTETVSSSDETFVAEIPYMLSNEFVLQVNNQVVNSKNVTVPANGEIKVTLNYQLTEADIAYMEELFPYGMYVEGFVKAVANDENEVSINMPFLAFYGDWTQAPMFDKTYFEVETTAHDNAIDDEDKVKADYYATTPYGSYFYSYIIPLGTYLYDIDTSAYDPIPASEEHIAISDIFGCIDGISNVYAGMLRSARSVNFVIRDKLTGEIVWSKTEYNEQKAHSNGGTAIPYYNELKMKAYANGLTNNRTYEFEMIAECDYGDGGLSTNVRNTFGFDFQVDNEAPIIKEIKYEKIYDKTEKKDRYYVYLTVYDNHYVMSVSPIILTSSSSYASLTNHPIPVQSVKGGDNIVKIEITDFLDDIYANPVVPNSLTFSIDDYALNTSIYICQLPGTRGDFKFTKDGTVDGDDYIVLSMYEDELVDLTQYLSTTDKTVDADKSYLKHLEWISSNESVVEVRNGTLLGINEGRATVTVQETVNYNKAVIIIDVLANPNRVSDNGELAEAGEDLPPLRYEGEKKPEYENIEEAALKKVRFSYFETLFAYSRSAQTSEIGETGDIKFISSFEGALSFYPGERIKLAYVIEPWYVKDKYEFTYESTNPSVVAVDQDGVVTGLKEGSATITLKTPTSTIMARLRVSIKNPFVIENRSLIAYKGLGGKVVIPDDEGILYIGSFAFCLYDTDYQVEIPDNDFDANKIPSANTTITEIVIPSGVERIEQYAFYNCTGLRKVTLGDDLKHIYNYAFYGDEKLSEINFEKVEYAGDHAFAGCKSLNNINTSRLFAVGSHAFDGCSSLESLDLTFLRNTGDTAFRDCTSLSDVKFGKDTKLSEAMFVRTGLTEVTLTNDNVILPAFIFAQCENLRSITFTGNLFEVQNGALSECPSLETVVFEGTVEYIASQVFYKDTALTSITLPNCTTTLGEWAFYMCENLSQIVFGAETYLSQIDAGSLQATKVSNFVINENNPYYKASDDAKLILSKDGKKIVLASGGYDFGSYTIPNEIEVIGESAFSGVDIEEIVITNPKTVFEFASFANCLNLKKIVLPNSSEVVIGDSVFYATESLETVENLDKILNIGKYAFSLSGLRKPTIGANAVLGEGAFYQSSITEMTIGANANFGLGAMQACKYLQTVNMPEDGGVHFGASCFANCTSLKTIDLSKHDPALEDEVFFNCTSLASAVLTNVINIGNYAFADCANLRYVDMPKVVVIGEGAFCAYQGTAPSFMQITLPSTLKTLGKGVFMGALGIEEIEIPKSVLNFGDNSSDDFGDFMFALCTNLKKVTLPENLDKIGNYWFTGCSKLQSVNTEKIKYIGEYAFRGASSDLEGYVEFDLSSIRTLGEAAFAESRLTGDLVCNNLTTAGDYAFFYTYIKSIDAPNLSVIGDSAFEGCKNLKEFAFSEKLQEIGLTVFTGANNLANYTFNDLSTTKINDKYFLDGGVLYKVLDEKKYEMLSVPSALKVKLYEVVEGTVRIELYAGNENKNIIELVLPDSLRVIGNYAFYGYTSLKNVEFKSFTAPVLENFYNSQASLSSSDPGYDLFHNQIDATNGAFELCYYNFIDLVGKKKPIQMTLPANSGLIGYDSLVYEGLFGKVENASRSTYVAMEQSMVDFIDSAKKICSLDVITIAHENLVFNAITLLNTITQNPENYGIDSKVWDMYVAKAKNAKAIVQRAKLKTATNYIKGLQAEIDALESFDISNFAELSALSTKIKALKGEDRSLLILDNFNSVLGEYDLYREEIENEIEPIKDLTNNIANVLASVLSLTTLAGASLYISKRASL